ncbi:MAG: hypothetical protein AAGA32_13320 [Pseudomonadota bacterium]
MLRSVLVNAQRKIEAGRGAAGLDPPLAFEQIYVARDLVDLSGRGLTMALRLPTTQSSRVLSAPFRLRAVFSNEPPARDSSFTLSTTEGAYLRPAR